MTEHAFFEKLIFSTSCLNVFQKYRVPKGWAVIYNIRDTHEFEYEDMDTFDPDRFAPNNATDDKFK